MAEIDTTTVPDFEAMTVEEIETWRVGLRDKMREIRELIVTSNEVFARKIDQQHRDTAALATGNNPVVVTPDPVGGQQNGH